jgi:hypothetical protein
MPSTKYSINLFNIIKEEISSTFTKSKLEIQNAINFQEIPLCIIPKWIYWKQEYYSDISLQKLEYIVKSSIYKNLDTELEVSTNFIGKFCDNKLCQKKLAKYDTWYCYDGYAYCCPNCRLNFIKKVYIKENLNSGFVLNQCIPEYSLEHINLDISAEDN